MVAVVLIIKQNVQNTEIKIASYKNIKLTFKHMHQKY